MNSPTLIVTYTQSWPSICASTAQWLRLCTPSTGFTRAWTARRRCRASRRWRWDTCRGVRPSWTECWEFHSARVPKDLSPVAGTASPRRCPGCHPDKFNRGHKGL